MSQNLYFQDTFNGGVTGGSYNPWLSSNPYTIELNIDEQSSIRKAFLFIGVYGQPLSTSMSLNNNEIILSEGLYSSEIFTTQASSNVVYYLRTAIMDITEFVNTSQINISPPINQPPLNQGRFVQFYILILYENSSLPETSVSVFLNEQNCSGIMNYQLNGVNSINPNHPVGLAINGAQMCNIDFDGSEVFVNDNHIGLIGGDDISSPYGCGVSGAFYYEQNLFNGLGDDVANNNVDGADAIADIQPYLNSNSTVDVSFVYQSFDNPPHPNAPFSNVIWQIYLVYTSTCEGLNISLLTSDTTTCAGVPVQLATSGGIAYNWLPQTNLSCYDCPNPIFIGDSTINYTVRIWASDSCSKVLPVRVRVSSCASLEELGSAFEIFAPTLVHGDLGGVYQIRMKNVLQYQYELYTLDGKVVYQKHGFSDSETLDLWDKALMESGLYLYRIWVLDETGNQEVVEGKVVVVR